MDPVIDNKEELEDRWGYLIDQWIQRFGSQPVKLWKHKDLGETYIKCEAHIFELENNEYALVVEEGCSCYSAVEADITLYGDYDDALEKFKEWVRNRRGGY